MFGLGFNPVVLEIVLEAIQATSTEVEFCVSILLCWK